MASMISRLHIRMVLTPVNHRPGSAMRSQARVLSVALLAGGASTPSLGSRTDRVSADAGPVGTLNYFTDVNVVANTIDTPIQQAWPHLIRVYQDMGIPITSLDSAAHIVGAAPASLSRQLGKRNVSYAVDCGSTTMTAQAIADTYRVSLTALTQLQPSGSRTAVRTSVTASARDQSGVPSDPLQCSSTGNLERDIAAALVAAP